MQCTHCATPVPDDARFCQACGSQVSDAEGQAAATAAMDQGAFNHMEALLREDTQGEFEIGRMLGRGGMAVVYLATEVHLSRNVAIKVLPPELTFGHGVERFKREAKTAAALDHPNIIPIYRISSGGKLFWYAMKYLEGRGLDELLKERNVFGLAETIKILAQVADALDYGHEHSVIHRDVKPANVMLDSRGRVVVTDFGIAKALTEGTLTASGSVIGTPYFMSPEQGMGKPVTGAADQYSTGVMAYRMLSGQLPFEGDSAIDILHKHCMMPPHPLETVAPDLPRHVYLAIHKSLEKDADRRFRTVTDFVEALRKPRESAGGRTSASDVATLVVPASVGASASTGGASIPGAASPATPTTPMPQTQPVGTLKKRMTLPAIAAAAVVVGVVGVFVATSGGGDDSTTPAAASQLAQQQAGNGVPGGPADSVMSADPRSVAPATGRVTVSRFPASGTVTIDGERRTGTEFDLEPGSHRIEMRARGYEDYAVDVDVAANVAVRLSFPRIQVVQQPVRQTPRPAARNPTPARAQPAPAGPTYAWLRVGVRAAGGGEIIIDGQSFGERRSVLHRVTAGVPHSIQVRSSGAVADTTVTLSAGETTLVVLRPRRQ